MSEPFVAGLVLAAGGSSRLGRPKQLLPFGRATLLDHTIAIARACEFGQLLVAVGGHADKVRRRVNLAGADVVVNPGYGEGCSSSIAVAMAALDPRATVLVLMLGDQPGVVPGTVRLLVAARGDAPIAVCRYEDGRGHPFAFGHEVFEELRNDEQMKDWVMEGPSVLGVETTSDTGVVIRAVADTRPSKKVDVERLMRARITQRLAERGIRAPVTAPAPPPAAT